MLNTVLQIIGTIFSLFFLYLLIKRNIWCWLFGILSSAITVYLLFDAKLYTESFLNFYYIIAGFYGWSVWKKDSTNPEPAYHDKLYVTEYSLTTHLGLILWGTGLSLPLGYYMSQNTDGNNPFIDSSITVFSFIATYLEAHRVRSGWIYWIVLNTSSSVLYFYRGLPIYSLLMLVYATFSFVGWLKWQKVVLQNHKLT